MSDLPRATRDAAVEAGATAIAGRSGFPVTGGDLNQARIVIEAALPVLLAGGLEIPGRTSASIARAFHEAYERLAPEYGYKTREESAKPWEDVPQQNKSLMIAVVEELLEAAPGLPPEPSEEALQAASDTLTEKALVLHEEELWAALRAAYRVDSTVSNVETETRVWLCAKCGYGAPEHATGGHPAYMCVWEPRLVEPCSPGLGGLTTEEIEAYEKFSGRPARVTSTREESDAYERFRSKLRAELASRADGAVGDGVTDDTAAFQATFDARFVREHEIRAERRGGRIGS